MASDVDRIAEVLNAHWSASTHSNHNPIVDKCDGCGEVILTWGGEGDSPSQLAAHQAEQLVAAGWVSPVDVARIKAEAKREALREAADAIRANIPAWWEGAAKIVADASWREGYANAHTDVADVLDARAAAVTEGVGE